MSPAFLIALTLAAGTRPHPDDVHMRVIRMTAATHGRYLAEGGPFEQEWSPERTAFLEPRSRAIAAVMEALGSANRLEEKASAGAPQWQVDALVHETEGHALRATEANAQADAAFAALRPDLAEHFAAARREGARPDLQRGAAAFRAASIAELGGDHVGAALERRIASIHTPHPDLHAPGLAGLLAVARARIDDGQWGRAESAVGAALAHLNGGPAVPAALHPLDRALAIVAAASVERRAAYAALQVSLASSGKNSQGR